MAGGSGEKMVRRSWELRSDAEPGIGDSAGVCPSVPIPGYISWQDVKSMFPTASVLCRTEATQAVGAWSPSFPSRTWDFPLLSC